MSRRRGERELFRSYGQQIILSLYFVAGGSGRVAKVSRVYRFALEFIRVDSSEIARIYV